MKELFTILGIIAISFGFLWCIVLPGAIGGITLAAGTFTTFLGGFFS